MKRKKFSTNSGLPVNFLRSSGSCVATPTGHVFRWQTRIMMQPDTTSGAVAKPNSSAPISAATTTSRPVFSWPSTCTTMRSRRPFIISTCCVSARPSSHGTPPCLMDVSGEAPVPPSWPEMSTTSACALATPAATVPTPDLGDELHVDARLRVRVLQVVDELRQVLDRVDVVVRRRRDQAHARRRVAHLRDPRIDLVAGQLAAFARLGALRHLDLEIVGVDEVFARHAEARGRDLLDGAPPRVAVGVRRVPRRILAAFAGVRLAAEPVHRDGERLVRFLADRAVRHRAGREALHDRLDRLDLVDRNRLSAPALELEQAAQRRAAPALIVHELRVLLEDRVLAAARRVLQLEDRVRVEQVVLAVAAPLVLAARLRDRPRRRPAAPGRRAGAARALPAAITSMPTPPMRDAVHVKYLSTNSRRARRLRRSARRSSSAASRCPSWTSP